MVESIEVNKFDNDSNSEELSEGELEQAAQWSGVAQMKLIGLKKAATVRSNVKAQNDVVHQGIYDAELGHLKDMIYERGYDSKQNDTLRNASTEEQAAWNSKKQELMNKDNQFDHAKDVKLTYKGMVVDQKLNKLRQEMINADHSLIVGDYYEKLPSMVNSKLYDVLKMLPKPAVHHAHLTACADLDFLVSLTRRDCVFYSQKENAFDISTEVKPCTTPGFVKVNTLRQYWKDPEEFDQYLKDKMALQSPGCCATDHKIWEGFQPKFSLTFKLYNYKPLFERILYRVTRDFINEMVTIVEYRHILGCVFDDYGNPLSTMEELAIFQKCLQEIQIRFPLFRMKLIICGLKMFGRGHIQSQLDAIIEADRSTNLISGFDMVNEEDYCLPIDDFLDQIMACKMKLGDRLQFYFHAGESYQRSNTELYDAILLGTKRIGHGFGLAMHPDLVQKVKDENICIEACPVSNKILGYVYDLRTHPTRSLLAQGVKVSINPDDHGFFGSPGVTLDYLIAYLSWDLNLNDLKQLCYNSLEFASIPDEDKPRIEQFFEYKWKAFLSYVRGKY